MSSTYSTESFYTTLEQKHNSVFFYLYGVVANSEKPFRVLVNDECVLKREQNTNGLIFAVEVEEPRAGGHHFIRTKVDCPLLRCGSGLTHHYERYNLSIGGFFFLIDCTGELLNESLENQSAVRVVQQRHDNFGSEFRNAKPANTETSKLLNQIASKTKNVIHSTLPPKDVEEKLLKLEQLYRKNILTKSEFEAKWRQLYPPPMDDEGLTEEQKELMTRLRGLVERGIVTQVEYDTKLNKLKQDNTLVTKNSVPVLSKEQSAMLEKLQSLFDKGILTNEEFEKKKQQIYQEAKSKQQELPITKQQEIKKESPQKSIISHSNSSQISFQEYSQQLQDLKNMMNETQRTQMTALDRFLNDGILNQEEYETKKKKVLSSLYFPTHWTHHKKILEMDMSVHEEEKKTSPVSSSSSDSSEQRISKLEKLTEKGILTPEMLESKKQQILEENRPVQDTEDLSHLSHDQQIKISKLKHLKKMGILTHEEFESQYQKVLLNSQSPSSPTTTSPTASPTTNVSSSSSNNNKLKSPTVSSSVSPTSNNSNHTSVKVSSPSKNPSSTLNTAVKSSFRVEEVNDEENKTRLSSPVYTAKESPRDIPKNIIIPKSSASSSSTTNNTNHHKKESHSSVSTPSKKLEKVEVKEVPSSPSTKMNNETIETSTQEMKAMTTKPTLDEIKSSSSSPQNELNPLSVQNTFSESTTLSTHPQTEEENAEIQEQLENLRLLVEMGVISEKDYLEKEERLLKGIHTPPSATASPTSTTKDSPIETTSNSNNTNTQIKQLEKLLNSGVISKDIFDQKVNKILGGNVSVTTPTTPTRNIVESPVEPKIQIPKKQEEKRNSSPIPQQESKHNGTTSNRDVLASPASHNNKANSVESPRQTNGSAEAELTKLKKLLNCGLITEEQYKLKEAKLLGNSSATTPTTAATTPEKVQPPTQIHETSTSSAQQLSNDNGSNKEEIDPVFGDLSSLNEEQKHQVTTLRQFLKEGLIDQEEFEEEVKQIIQSSH
ncbi:hypothetical protein C9374_005055 [Naegleria lovaniensis]|uniref:SHOCT domain-containing protein n=1 Tax=Naegleria lovaniensis TaxID=51637 RepID=A0AA88KKA7_NAELO|nr:uncharacterized protein C9374_005055 [Naegleria lovaniensis]KAG2382475.1 hypothetical protein C9374_005055 [Naegleria lovaniensis]